MVGAIRNTTDENENSKEDKKKYKVFVTSQLPGEVDGPTQTQSLRIWKEEENRQCLRRVVGGGAK